MKRECGFRELLMKKECGLRELDVIFSRHGGIYKVIDEYRELLEWIFLKNPELKNDLDKAWWISRIAREHDRFLHEIASLQSQNTRIKDAKTGEIRVFPLDIQECDRMLVEEYDISR